MQFLRQKILERRGKNFYKIASYELIFIRNNSFGQQSLFWFFITTFSWRSVRGPSWLVWNGRNGNNVILKKQLWYNIAGGKVPDEVEIAMITFDNIFDLWLT